MVIEVGVLGLEDAKEGATPTSNRQPHPQDPTPQRDRRIIRGAEAHDGRRATGSGRAEERRRRARNPTRVVVVDAMRETRETWAEGERGVDKKVLVQWISAQKI